MGPTTLLLFQAHQKACVTSPCSSRLSSSPRRSATVHAQFPCNQQRTWYFPRAKRQPATGPPRTQGDIAGLDWISSVPVTTVALLSPMHALYNLRRHPTLPGCPSAFPAHQGVSSSQLSRPLACMLARGCDRHCTYARKTRLEPRKKLRLLAFDCEMRQHPVLGVPRLLLFSLAWHQLRAPRSEEHTSELQSLV